jgi:hypothetical protein
MLLAASLLGAVAYATWYGLDEALGRDFVAQAIAVGGAIAAGFAVYGLAVWALRVPEARQFRDLLVRRRRAGG